MDLQTLITQVKEMQRQDPTAKEQWYAYCENFGSNMRDPAKHDPSFIQSFISQYQAGARLEFKEGQELVKMIKLGQKKSQAWKGVWEAYCNFKKSPEGRPMYDPAKHDIGSLEGFFDFVGSNAARLMGGVGGGMGMVPPPMMQPPNKRQKTNGGTSFFMSAGKEAMVAAIKKFQRQGEAQKAAWHSFCDANTNRMYDPGRLEEGVLTAFMSAHGITVDTDGGGGAMSMGGGMNTMGGMGGMSSSMGGCMNDMGGMSNMGGISNMGGMGGMSAPGGNKDSLVHAIKGFQRQGEAQKAAWHSFCDANTNGMYDPNRLDPSILQMFASASGISVSPSSSPIMPTMGSGFNMGGCGGSSDPNKANLVHAVKGFQRQGEAQKQAWHSFCDANTNGMYDPNRLDSTVLQAFTSANGIMVSASAPTNPAMGMATGGWGGPPAPAADPIKEGLVQAIKGFQRTGQAAKDVWHAFCDANTNGMYDPGRLDAVALQTFISQHGIVPTAGSTPHLGNANPEIVNRIKTFQRISQENKDTWHSFCDTNTDGMYDPARLDSDVLQQFIDMYGVP